MIANGYRTVDMILYIVVVLSSKYRNERVEVGSSARY
jgi:hypothetical protein